MTMNAPQIPGWQSMDSAQRARAVIDWCQANDIYPASILPRELAAAMAMLASIVRDERRALGESEPAEVSFAPMDYVNQIRVIAACLMARR